MTAKKKDYAVILLFLLIIGIRFININMPILEGTATRQVQTASIARNFFKDGINMLYPRADHFGNDPGYLVLEFPIMNALAACGYKLLGGVHEWVGRLLSIIFFSGAAYLLFAIAKKVFGRDTAFWAVLAFGLSPLSVIFSRAFMPDFEMLFFCLASLYFFLKFYENGDYLSFWISCIFSMLALLVKPHSFYIFIPLLYLLWKKQGYKFIVDYKNGIYLFVCLIPAILWYMHGRAIIMPEETYNYTLTNWFDLKVLLSRSFYTSLIEIYSGILLTPFGFVLFIGGLFIKTKQDEGLIWAWFAGAVIFTLAFITHILDPYYNLNMLPVASIFIARMIVFMGGIDLKKTFLQKRWARAALVMLILPFWLRYAAYAYVVPKGYRYIPEAGKRVQEITAKDDLIIASAAGGPQALYFCDRRGWSFLLPVTAETDAKYAIERLEELRKKGAKFFVACVMDDFNISPIYKEYMFKHYEAIEHKPGRYIIFFLT